MRLRTIAVLLAVLSGLAATPQEPTDNVYLPTLYKIQHITLSPSYSCRTPEEVANGYQSTALFLTRPSVRLNRPELLFNGACGSPDYFQGATAGDQLDVLADYGNIPLESLTGNHVFNTARVVGHDEKFSQAQPVVTGHTYGMLINKPDERGFFYFHVTAYVPNRSVELDYAIMDYAIMREEARSPGFAWNVTPTLEPPPPRPRPQR